MVYIYRYNFALAECSVRHLLRRRRNYAGGRLNEFRVFISRVKRASFSQRNRWRPASGSGSPLASLVVLEKTLSVPVFGKCLQARALVAVPPGTGIPFPDFYLPSRKGLMAISRFAQKCSSVVNSSYMVAGRKGSGDLAVSGGSS